MTLPKATPKPKPSALFTLALRHERDCWNVLVMHTLRCTACLAVQRVIGQHGYACDAGRAIRAEWLSAAQRRYELSPDFTSTDYKPVFVGSEALMQHKK